VEEDGCKKAERGTHRRLAMSYLHSEDQIATGCGKTRFAALRNNRR
jgi:hypothetical protein